MVEHVAPAPTPVTVAKHITPRSYSVCRICFCGGVHRSSGKFRNASAYTNSCRGTPFSYGGAHRSAPAASNGVSAHTVLTELVPVVEHISPAPAQFWCSLESNLSGSSKLSSLGKVYSRQATDNVSCENSSVSSVMKYCPTSTVVRNPASVQILITRFCCESLSTFLVLLQ